MFSFNTKLTAMAGLLALLAAAPAGAVIIDDFSDAQGPVNGGSGFQLGSMLGGERDVFASTGGSFTASAGVATASGANVGTLYDGVDGSGTASYGLVGVDLTDGGLSDRFLLNIVSVTASASLRLSVFENTSDSLLGLTGTGAGPGLITVLFSDLIAGGLGADLTDAKQVNLQLPFLQSGQTVMFDNFCTGNASGCVGGGSTAVPEPSTWLLMAGGLALLGLRRRRRS